MTAAHAIDFTNWKLTLPISAFGSKGAGEVPGSVLDTDLDANEWEPYFVSGVDKYGSYVGFLAPVNGLTTSGSGYPRSELREMNGTKLASWGGNDGKIHTFLERIAWVGLPGGKPHVVGGQIHDASDDYCVFRLEGPNLWLTSGNNTHFKLLSNSYVLGTPVDLAWVVGNKKCLVYFNGALVATLNASKLKGAYFKCGAYVQANKSNAVPYDASNIGAVKVYGLQVTHGSKAGAVTFPPATTPTDPVPPVDGPPVEQPPTQPIPPVIPKAKRTIIMLRHGEKDDNADGKDDTLHELSATGKKRAEAFKVAWLAGPPNGLPKPDRCVASKGNTASNRPLKTIEPYQLAAGLPMNTKYDAEVDYKTLGPWLAQRLDTTLVCMEHSAIINTFKLLGKIDPPLPKAWDDKRFDLYWVFTSDDGKNWKFTQVPELLLPGDKTTPIK